MLGKRLGPCRWDVLRERELEGAKPLLVSPVSCLLGFRLRTLTPIFTDCVEWNEIIQENPGDCTWHIIDVEFTPTVTILAGVLDAV